ncbi:MAG TPA: hypothetical protein VFF79_04905 [Conexibacter sp.]|nr:hypothetical protein [Conexibacter sp.]
MAQTARPLVALLRRGLQALASFGTLQVLNGLALGEQPQIVECLPRQSGSGLRTILQGRLVPVASDRLQRIAHLLGFVLSDGSQTVESIEDFGLP